MIVSILALLVCLIGLLVYVLATNTKAVEIGRICFFCGLLVLLLAHGQHTVKF